MCINTNSALPISRVNNDENDKNFRNFIYRREYKQPGVAVKATSYTPNGALTRDKYLEILKKREELKAYKLSLDQEEEAPEGEEEEA